MLRISILAVAIALFTLVPAVAFAQPAGAGGGVGPPHGNFYANDAQYRTVVTPTVLHGKGPTDTLYMFPDCAKCAPVSDAAPGDTSYNGGRWVVVLAHGITTQFTNSEDVVANAGSLETTDVRFVCPLIRQVG